MDYGGLEKVHIPATLLWTPDIVLYNKYKVTEMSLNLKIKDIF